jgi:capsule polysaccharide export protein KpsE/RkpR
MQHQKQQNNFISYHVGFYKFGLQGKLKLKLNKMTSNLQTELFELANQLDSIEKRLSQSSPTGAQSLSLLNGLHQLRTEIDRLKAEEADLLEKQTVRFTGCVLNTLPLFSAFNTYRRL